MSAVEDLEYLSLEAFTHQYVQAGPFEVVDGERKPLSPLDGRKAALARALFDQLDAHCAMHRLGEVRCEIPYVLLYDFHAVKDVRVPHLMMFGAARWKQYVTETEDWAGKPLLLVPDLTVEILCATDLFAEIQDRVERYLNDGVCVIWVVDGERRRVWVYERYRYSLLTEYDDLSGGDVMPGLSLSLIDLFSSVP